MHVVSFQFLKPLHTSASLIFDVIGGSLFILSGMMKEVRNSRSKSSSPYHAGGDVLLSVVALLPDRGWSR